MFQLCMPLAAMLAENNTSAETVRFLRPAPNVFRSFLNHGFAYGLRPLF